MGITKEELLQIQSFYQVTNDDLNRIRAAGQKLIPQIPQFVAAFYEWLRNLPEYKDHFSDPARLSRVQKFTADYWREFYQAEFNESYVAKRRKVGETHVQIRLSLPAYFSAMNTAMVLWSEMIAKSVDAPLVNETIRSVTKMVMLDTAQVVETFAEVSNKKMADQHRAIMEMSTPVTTIWEGILLLPVVGIIDSNRAQDIMNAMLTRIGETQARVFILDISGVGIVDTAVANHLIKMTKATRLMGCTCCISGISPAIAQTMVELGVEVGDILTHANLRDALQAAFTRLGIHLRQDDK
jgi:rsbT co-antagonist protein RsbR